MVQFEVPKNHFAPIGDSIGTISISTLGHYILIPVWIDTSTPIAIAFHLGAGSSGAAEISLHSINAANFTEGTALENDYLGLAPGWVVYPVQGTYSAGLYVLKVMKMVVSGVAYFTVRHLPWYPRLYVAARYYTGSYQWDSQGRTFCYCYQYSSSSYTGQVFSANDTFMLSNTSVMAASVFDLDTQITLYGVTIPSTSTGPYRVSLYTVGSNGLPTTEVEGGTAYHYPMDTGVNMVRFMFSTPYTVRRFAIVWKLEAGGSTSSRWYGGMKTTDSAFRTGAFPEAYAANYDGTVWTADYTLVRPLQLISDTDFQSSSSSGFPPTSFYRRMI